ncbi:NUDIX domain-containing protein [Streptomyces platensis]|uniref:NUDIX domain-containing protein n=1 Tax=Streptomyces platensis TaxID=58346 RepID=UPI0034D79534|nr:NUDIX domain-containing protein [Streptomyces platensis]
MALFYCTKVVGRWARAHGAQRARDPRVGHTQCVHLVWHGGSVLGVIEPGESREQALVREVRQELGHRTRPRAPGLRHAGHGARPRPRQHRTTHALLHGAGHGEPKPAREIEEMAWVDSRDTGAAAPRRLSPCCATCAVKGNAAEHRTPAIAHSLFQSSRVSSPRTRAPPPGSRTQEVVPGQTARSIENAGERRGTSSDGYVRGWTWCVLLCSVCPWSRRSCLLGEAGLLSRLGGIYDEGPCVAGDTAPQVGREVGQ